MSPTRLALLGTGGRGQIYVDVMNRMEPGRAEWTAMVGRTPATVANFCAENELACPQVIGMEKLAEIIQGQAVVFTGQDVILVAKTVVETQKTLKGKVMVRGGWLDGRALSAQDVATLASIPPVETLHLMVVRAVQAPLRMLVQVLNGLQKKLVVVLNRIAEKASEPAGGSEA